MKKKNPCLSCGACCAFFRVSFFWGETDPGLGGEVPVELTELLDDSYCCMQGTNRKSPHCIALDGEIGKAVACSIYQQRSSSCREFGIHDQNGLISIDSADLERCNAARNAWGLPPIHLDLDSSCFKKRLSLFHRRHLERIHTHRSSGSIPV